MFGRILGKVLSTPVRLVNVAVKAADAVVDPVSRPLRDRDPLGLDQVADAIDEAAQRADD